MAGGFGLGDLVVTLAQVADVVAQAPVPVELQQQALQTAVDRLTPLVLPGDLGDALETLAPKAIDFLTGTPIGTVAFDALDVGPAQANAFQLATLGAPVFDDIFGGSLFDDFSLGDVLGGIQDVSNTISGIQNIFGGGGGGGFPAVVPTGAQGGTLMQTGLMTDSGDPVNGDYGGGNIQTASLGGALATGGIWLGSLLMRAMGRGAAGAVFTAANGVRVRLSQLWPLVRRYGTQAVAGGLGITVGALGTLMMEPAALQGRSGRKRGRGISARDVKTTRRTIKTLRSLTRMAGIGGGGGYRRRSYYRPRRRSRYYC